MYETINIWITNSLIVEGLWAWAELGQPERLIWTQLSKGHVIMCDVITFNDFVFSYNDGKITSSSRKVTPVEHVFGINYNWQHSTFFLVKLTNKVNIFFPINWTFVIVSEILPTICLFCLWKRNGIMSPINYAHLPCPLL